MRILYKIKYIFLLFIININCYSNNTIENKKVGYLLKIPNNVNIRNNKEQNISLETIIKNNPGKYYFEVKSYPFKEFRTKYDKEETLKRLEKNEYALAKYYSSQYDNGSLNVFKYKNKKIGQYVFSIGTPQVGWMYEKFLNILKDDYIIHISIMYFDPEDKIAKNYSEYFEYETGEGYYWKEPIDNKPKEFYNLIKTKSPKAPKELIKLEEYFDEIINSLELFDSGSNYYTPTVNNLRFRETPDLNGKYIRSLKEDEKLELIEKGKTETINGTKGTWVKVKTEKGEVGWCFDAYLEEVKKK